MVNCREVEFRGHTFAIHEMETSVDPATGKVLAGSWLWDCSLVLANWLQTGAWPPGSLKGKRAVEIGAGTGLPGLAAAALGADVTLTDIPALVPNLERNIAANAARLAPGRAAAAPLVWGQDCRHLAPPVDLVLGSDVMYDTESMGPLSETLKALSDSRTEIYIAYELRNGTTDCFQALANRGLRCSMLPKEDLHPDWSSDDIGIFRIQLKDADPAGG